VSAVADYLGLRLNDSLCNASSRFFDTFSLRCASEQGYSTKSIIIFTGLTLFQFLQWELGIQHDVYLPPSLENRLSDVHTAMEHYKLLALGPCQQGSCR